MTKDKVLDFLKKEEPLISEFLQKLDNGRIDYAILGGLPRNILKGRMSARDIDIVVDSDNIKDLIDIFSSCKVEKNRFGENKIKLANMDIDIWLLKDTYGIKKGFYDCSFDGLLESTIINYDSLIYHNGKFKGHYLDFEKTHKLDLITRTSPIANNFHMGTLVKCLYIIRTEQCKVSTRLQEYLKDVMGMLSYEDILKEYNSRYDIPYNKELPMPKFLGRTKR